MLWFPFWIDLRLIRRSHFLGTFFWKFFCRESFQLNLLIKLIPTSSYLGDSPHLFLLKAISSCIPSNCAIGSDLNAFRKMIIISKYLYIRLIKRDKWAWRNVQSPTAQIGKLAGLPLCMPGDAQNMNFLLWTSNLNRKTKTQLRSLTTYG